MKHIQEIYQDQLLYVFKSSQLKQQDIQYLVIVKDETTIEPLEDCLIMHYSEPFEELLTIQLPSKIRKLNKLLPLKTCQEIIQQHTYGTCTFNNQDYPYVFPINHVVYQGRIFFHCGLKGYKLTGIDQKATYNVIDDLGINLEIGTHNHRSVNIFGTLKEVKDEALKKEILLKLVHDLAPKHPYRDAMIKTTTILEFDIDYMIGKAHIY